MEFECSVEETCMPSVIFFFCVYVFFFLSKSLFDIVNKIHQMINSGKLGSTVKPNSLVTSSAGTARTVQEKPFDAMNNIVANLLLNLTR